MALSESEVKKITGLSNDEAKISLEKHGFNELPSSKKRGL